jgi:hypothetical protein
LQAFCAATSAAKFWNRIWELQAYLTTPAGDSCIGGSHTVFKFSIKLWLRNHSFRGRWKEGCRDYAARRLLLAAICRSDRQLEDRFMPEVDIPVDE